VETTRFIGSMCSEDNDDLQCILLGEDVGHSDWPSAYSNSSHGPRIRELSIPVGLATACSIQVADHSLDGLCICVVSLCG
jgi:hypothetical protein